MLYRKILALSLFPLLVRMERVVIVGGGMAGIAAARYLTDNSNLSVLLLEANQQRYGGRIWTYRLPDFPAVELGAMWLHGGASIDHPVASICRKASLPLIKHDAMEPSMVKVFDLAGKEVPIQELTYLMELFQETEKVREERLAEGKPDLPILAALKQDNPGTFQRLMSHPVVKNYAASALESYHSGKLEDLSLFFTTGTPNSEEVVDLESYDDMVLPNGYSAVLDLLVTKGLPFHLHLDHKVEEIKVEPNKGVKLKVRKSDQAQDINIDADFVIVAVPLGVLKTRAIRFLPELPSDHQLAIERIGFGNMVKVLLVFDMPFWTDIELIGVETGDPPGFPLCFVNLNRVHGLPALLAMLSGEAADMADGMNEGEIAHKLTEVLGRLYGAINVTKRRLTHIKVTRWKQDPLFQGVYSYGKYGMTSEDTYNVRKPIFPSLYFAGEYTEFPSEQHGTVHAAYSSGIRAAKQIIAQASKASTSLSISMILSLICSVCHFA